MLRDFLGSQLNKVKTFIIQRDYEETRNNRKHNKTTKSETKGHFNTPSQHYHSRCNRPRSRGESRLREPTDLKRQHSLGEVTGWLWIIKALSRDIELFRGQTQHWK